MKYKSNKTKVTYPILNYNFYYKTIYLFLRQQRYVNVFATLWISLFIFPRIFHVNLSSHYIIPTAFPYVLGNLYVVDISLIYYNFFRNFDILFIDSSFQIEFFILTNNGSRNLLINNFLFFFMNWISSNYDKPNNIFNEITYINYTCSCAVF